MTKYKIIKMTYDTDGDLAGWTILKDDGKNVTASNYYFDTRQEARDYAKTLQESEIRAFEAKQKAEEAEKAKQIEREVVDAVNQVTAKSKKITDSISNGTINLGKLSLDLSELSDLLMKQFEKLNNVKTF